MTAILTDTTPAQGERPDRAGTTTRFVVLDGLRGAGAIAVILDHVPPEMVGGLLPGRALSVDFFFVLSGFVLAHAYGERLTSSLSTLAFLRLRLIRLYPLYFLGMLIGMGVAAYGIANGLRSWKNPAASAMLGLFFLPKPPFSGVWNAGLYPLNPPAWSLLYELFANGVYALVARFLTLRVLLVGLPVAAVLLAAATFRHGDVTGAGWLWSHADSGLARVMYGFFAGVLIHRLRGMWRIPALPAWLSIAGFLAVIAVPAQGAARPAFDVAAAVVLLPLLVLLSVNGQVQGVTARVCTLLGRLSYGIYMLHVPLLGVSEVVLARFGITLPNVVFVLLLIVTAGLGAYIADRFYDARARRWLERRLPRFGR
jgi:peptidoglycan/LPS O-acetylase OafA/YrhL